MEAKLVKLSDKMVDGGAVDEFTKEQEKIISINYCIHQNKTSTNSLVIKERGKSGAKYMKVRQALAKERHSSKDFEISYIKMGKLITKILTKLVNGKKFHMLMLMLLNVMELLCTLVNKCLDNRGTEQCHVRCSHRWALI